MATLRRQRSQRGVALFLYGLMVIVSVGCIGLAVDVGTIYMIKARLSAAVDAAALAGGRSVNFANTTAQAQSNFTTTADNFMSANFPTGYFNTLSAPTVTPLFSEETDSNGNLDGVLDFKVSASVAAPTYFMKIFGVNSVTVGATGTASRRGLVLMLVLDISSSMNTATTPTACQAMATAAQNFMTMFSPYDNVGLVTFDITAHLMDSPSNNFTQVSNDIAAITCGSNTNTVAALDMAYQQIKNMAMPLALNTIVLFTNGSPNGITANFPARAPSSADTRWGPAMSTPTPPAQSGSTYDGIPNSCNDDVGAADANGVQTNAACVGMPVVCTASSATLFGTLAQWGDQNSYGADTYGLAPPTSDRNNNPTAPLVSIPSSCNDSGGLPSVNIRQFIAYIPNTDYYGNSLINGVAATGTSPYGTVSGGYDNRSGWLFQINNECSPDSSVVPNCKNIGDLWSSHNTVGLATNYFTSGPYSGYMRPDQPNTIVAAGMNATMAEAYKIRSDTTYNPVIHTIYLTGNGTDSVDREFLAIVANAPNILALPYDATYNSTNDPVLYANPAYQTNQQTGKYLVTADKSTLTSLFAQLASEVLRLSH